MRRVLGCALLMPVVLGLTAAPVEAAERPYDEYVALGDSWSADVVIFDGDGLPDDTHVPIDCAQSHTNYPKLVAKALGVLVLRDATCGSATTYHMRHPQRLPLGGINPPQFDRLSRTTDLVTIGIGGNDAGIAAAAMECLSAAPVGVPLPDLGLPSIPLPLLSLSTLPLGGCMERFTAGGVDQLAQQIRESRPKVVRALRGIHRRAPHARVLIVNYLAGLSAKGCWPVVPVTNPDMDYLHATLEKLNRMVRKAARRGGAELVDTYTPSIGHGVCASPTRRYVEGLGIVSVNDAAVAVPVHPNAAGARAQARAVLSRMGR